jgi:ElaB/YqjD/DUF883 family membrane-anchored ribosome-binding protein
MNELMQPTVGHGARTMKEGALELKDAVVNTTTRTATQCRNSTEKMIKSAPYKSVLIAFGIGALASALLFRRK